MAKKQNNNSKKTATDTKKSSTKKKGEDKSNNNSESLLKNGKQKQKLPQQQQSNRSKITQTSSWTGKLPHTLLHEHCQKRKWNKVEYDMRRIGDKGMVATAILSYTDPKTKENLTLKFTDPLYNRETKSGGVLLPQETPAEARHMAATLALCRIAYNTNMHMMLPPNHRQLWYKLDDYRKDLLKNKQTRRCNKLFDPEPFTTLLEERKNKLLKEKELEAQKAQKDKALKTPQIITEKSEAPVIAKKPIEKTVHLKNQKSNSSGTNTFKIRFPPKVWETTIFLDLSEKNRNMIENELKSHISWISKMRESNYNTQEDISVLEQKLMALGFRKAHVKEALKYEDPLAFLLIHLPEDDLPTYFQKNIEDTKFKVEISKLSIDKKNKISRISEMGCSSDEAEYALEINDWDENLACAYLTENLVYPVYKVDKDSVYDLTMWLDEIQSLQAIYGEDIFRLANETTCMIQIDSKLKLKLYYTKDYPNKLPGIIISTFNKNYKLPNYIKLETLTKLITYIGEYNLLGDMLVFHIYEWVKENISKIIENPGPLFDPLSLNNTASLSTATAGTLAKKDNKYNRYNVSKHTPFSHQEIIKLKGAYDIKIQSLDYKLMLEQRKALPAWSKQKSIIDVITSNNVTLITGETGSGKSTQIVQFLLDDLISKKGDFTKKIICTQPRRISAIGLAERVSDERCTAVGGDEVGYIIRGVNRSTKNTRIRFMTTGVLVRILQTDLAYLHDSIVVIDEVHERSIDTDLIVILLKNLLSKVKDLKIVLMSATVNVDIFKNYFDNKLGRCHIEGRTFPIKDYFLDEILPALNFKIKSNKFREEFDDESPEYLVPTANSKFFKTGQINYDLITDLIGHIDQKLTRENNDGSIIVFLPGVAEISRSCKSISNAYQNLVVLPLHSALSPEDQKKVFKKFVGKRKVIVSTNIAETSITIDDCVSTIDTGRAKAMYYLPKENSTKLIEHFISKAESKQRRGRAGRVRSGYSYKLYSRDVYENDMADLPTPEIKRVSLDSLYLSVKAMGIQNVTKFLSKGLDPPPIKVLLKSEQNLTTVGLLNKEDKSLTQLGSFISMMPVMDSKHGKLLIYSIIFGCADIGVMIASILSVSDMPFTGGLENRDKIKAVINKYSKKYNECGDLVAVTKLLESYFDGSNAAENKKKFVTSNFLSYNKLNEINSARAQFYSILEDIGFLPLKYKPYAETYLNRNGQNIEMIKCVLTGAFYPHVSRVQFPDPKYMNTSSGAIEKDPDARQIRYWIRNEQYMENVYQQKIVNENALPSTRAFIHPSSVFFSTNNSNAAAEDAEEQTNDVSKIDTKTVKKLKASFLLYNTSQTTTKLYLRTITPSSELAVLLFGGPIDYNIDTEARSRGIVVDSWLPIRTWCKNGVLIKELRILLDQAIKIKLENPFYSTKNYEFSKADDILEVVEVLVQSEEC
ncbi:related to Putative ATP-dependent RNA helicase YLR419W [Saccharomycodes ludwigii]|uniref:Related to Putative ATP-dependent RNA helicase YLR419W n=1 Tax=Saccharomycodes ludwigii TaxID=36035 RepID=A0A376B6V0_9ASCO|nr:hypothetical protein SCDLUD_004295 [Saccharomycodes ludwigii]KAH3899979.1 hypothetical protein SCDLUD_004295 [Saccharomycodes ludwigii]SSD60416.1 related to Putative ATP-dependent RNA helicase YLR419W [Saccharomycodes ludwigii]